LPESPPFVSTERLPFSAESLPSSTDYAVVQNGLLPHLDNAFFHRHQLCLARPVPWTPDETITVGSLLQILIQ